MAPLDAEEEEEEAAEEQEGEDAVDAEGWRNLMDGKIKSRVLSQGSGPCPEMNQDVRCSFEISLRPPADGSPGKVLQRYRDWRFRIGEGEAVPMLELSLRHMPEGSEFEVQGTSQWAWGPTGLPAAAADEEAIPPDADVFFHVVLHECFPFGHGTSEWNEQIQAVTWRKTNGNDHFKRKEFAKAKKSYKLALEVFHGTFEPPPHLANAKAAAATAASLVADCGANLAAVHLEMDAPVAAKEAAHDALGISENHMKALYRLARACLILDEFQECEEAVQRALAIEPENAGIKKVQADLKKKQQQYSSRSKKVASRLMQGLHDDHGDGPSASRAGEAPAEEPQPRGAEPVAEEASTPWWRSPRALLECIDKRYLYLALACALVLLVSFLALPREQFRQVFQCIILGFPAVGAIHVIAMGDEEEKRRQI